MRPISLPFLLLVLVLAAGALVFRTLSLDLRPLHTDEAVHAAKLGILLDTGAYTYDPREYHGPTLYYFSLPFVALSGARGYAEIASAVPLRLAPALFGTALVLLPLLLLDGIGRRAALLAGALAALSPAFVFYSRYAIQEVLFVFFTWAAVGCAWRYLQRPGAGWAAAAGAAVGLMQATKETSVIAYVCAVAAAGLAVVAAHGLERQHREPRAAVRPRHVALAAAVAVAVAVLVLSNFLRNPQAALDMFRAYSTYLGRAGTGDGHGTGAGAHVHPWHYYLRLLAFSRQGRGPWWSEGMILGLALIGMAPALRPALAPFANRHLVRFLVLFTLSQAVVYSVIPYKTPWNMLVFLYGFVVLAGVGGVVILDRLPGWWWKAAALALLATGAWHLGVQSWRASFTWHADPRNPYVYGHTSTNLLRLVERVEGLAAVHPRGREMPVQVVAPGDDYWPLPWYLRRFTNVGFYSATPETLAAPVIITAPALAGQTEERLGEGYVQEFYGLRPDVLLTIFIQEPLWREFLRAQQEEGA